MAGSAVGRHRHCAQLRGGSGAQRQVSEHLGTGRTDERVVAVTEVVFEVAGADRRVVSAGSGRGKGRLAGAQVMVDREEEVVSGPHGRPDQDDAVLVGAEDLAAGLQLCPPFAERADADAAALGLDQPVHLFRLVPSPQSGSVLFGSLNVLLRR
ncbi:hypothetical protein GCM10023238_11140 [Streptomyces heliomycini]